MQALGEHVVSLATELYASNSQQVKFLADAIPSDSVNCSHCATLYNFYHDHTQIWERVLRAIGISVHQLPAYVTGSLTIAGAAESVLTDFLHVARPGGELLPLIAISLLSIHLAAASDDPKQFNTALGSAFPAFFDRMCMAESIFHVISTINADVCPLTL